VVEAMMRFLPFGGEFAGFWADSRRQMPSTPPVAPTLLKAMRSRQFVADALLMFLLCS
jgi:hypothetical protein